MAKLVSSEVTEDVKLTLHNGDVVNVSHLPDALYQMALIHGLELMQVLEKLPSGYVQRKA